MKSRDILTAQLGQKVTCPWPRWYFTACWAEVTLMTSLSPETPGRYSATLLLHSPDPEMTSSSRTRPVYQFYPVEVGQRGAGAFNHSFRQLKDTLSWPVQQERHFVII